MDGITFLQYVCHVIKTKQQFNFIIMRTFDKYKQNLRQDGNRIISYTTHVATIDGDNLKQLGYWSVTTQKHVNYVANQLNLTLIK